MPICLPHVASIGSSLYNGLPIEAEWAIQMGKDIALLLKSDAIYMLPDWQHSEGATIEYIIARHRGMRIFLAETFETNTNTTNETEATLLAAACHCQGQKYQDGRVQ